MHEKQCEIKFAITHDDNNNFSQKHNSVGKHDASVTGKKSCLLNQILFLQHPFKILREWRGEEGVDTGPNKNLQTKNMKR